MACEDYPCCGHEPGDCPRIDSDGNERWRCVGCSCTLPLKSRSSFCEDCIRNQVYLDPEDRDDYGREYDDDEDEIDTDEGRE